MNIINKVTLRQLKENKRRTLVTMITTVATLGVSFLDLMTRQHIYTNGEWHVHYRDVTPDQIDQYSETEKLVLLSDGYAAFKESINAYKPYLFVQNYDHADTCTEIKSVFYL